MPSNRLDSNCGGARIQTNLRGTSGSKHSVLKGGQGRREKEALKVSARGSRKSASGDNECGRLANGREKMERPLHYSTSGRIILHYLFKTCGGGGAVGDSQVSGEHSCSRDALISVLEGAPFLSISLQQRPRTVPRNSKAICESA